MRPNQVRDKSLRRSKRHRSVALQYMLRNFEPVDGRGMQRQVVRACVAVCRTVMGCADYVAPNSKEAQLTCSKLIQF